MKPKQNKKAILFICPLFFNYYKDISAQFNKMGFDVIFFSDKPSEKPLLKAILRINHHNLPLTRRRYYRRIFKKTNDRKIDYFVVIDGQGISLKFIRKFKQVHPESKNVLYFWDTLKNYPYFNDMVELFDKVYSFEPVDCDEDKINFLHTFYRPDYSNVSNNSEIIYDAAFIGTTRPNKYVFVEKISHYFKKLGKKTFVYYYLPTKLLFHYFKLLDPRFESARKKQFHFKTLSNEAVIDIYNKSQVIIDSPPDGQTGITVRCYESIAMHKKVITNNANMSNINDKNISDNILIYPFSKKELDQFLSKPIVVSDDFYKEYSLENFCNKLLGIK